ncbi:DUF974-domain-containing protein [Panus rudis PR-1116 ss-1]|nr:DUF974-domain-containing protein [Panus rudis PR-1116 ss-1]
MAARTSLDAQAGAPHLLSLKVMRVSRPSLSSSWEPFYSSSPSFSARSTASIMSLQTKDALPGHPKTLRDFNLTETMMLPASFGAIQLGETFSGCMSVNNDATVDIEGVTLRVEMQSNSARVILAEFGGPDFRLAANDTMENVVHHEIKELGQHVLACTVSYRLPPGARPPATNVESTDPSIQSFRKFYKFSVTNPLSVKTKVHTAKSPSALVFPTEREKVFLEVHIQNLTPDAMWLQRMQFECAEGWTVYDANMLPNTTASHHKKSSESIFDGSMALMQPQDMRQYIYILSPIVIPAFHTPPAQGSVIALGRLDISWRSSFGEPGRLLTSMLSRRIPLIHAPPQSPVPPPAPPPKQPVSAVPSYLQRSATIGGPPSRTQSPQIPHRPLSPPVNAPAPYRPGSPFNRNRQSTVIPTPPTRSQSPALVSPKPPPLRNPGGIEVDLVVKSIPRTSLAIDKPFTIACTVTVNAPVPVPVAGLSRKRRVITLAIQHLQPPRLPTTKLAPNPEPWSPRLPSSGFSTPSPYGTPLRGNFHDTLAQKLLVASPRQITGEIESDAETEADGHESAQLTPAPFTADRKRPPALSLPPPFLAAVDANGEPTRMPSREAHFLGPSAMVLPPLTLTPPEALDLGSLEETVKTSTPGPPPGQSHERNWSESTITTASESDADSELEVLANKPILNRFTRVLASQDFELEYVPRKAGFLSVGGLRILSVDDRLVEETEGEAEMAEAEAGKRPENVQTLKEVEIVAEVWVQTSPSSPAPAE